jgi:hypothetical protein
MKIVVFGGQMEPHLGKTFLHKFVLGKIFSKTSRFISIKLDANYPCMKRIQVCLDKETNPHQRGDNHKNSNIGWVHLKILFSIELMIQKKLRFT